MSIHIGVEQAESTTSGGGKYNDLIHIPIFHTGIFARAKRDRAMADARNRIAHEIEVQERFKVANRADSDKGIQKLAIMNEGAIMAYKHALSEIDAAALKEQERGK